MRASTLRLSLLGNLGAVIRNDGRKIPLLRARNSTMAEIPPKSARKPKTRQKRKNSPKHTLAWSNAVGMLTLKENLAIPTLLGTRASRLEQIHEKMEGKEEMTVASQIVESELLRARRSLLTLKKMLAFKSNDRFFRKLHYVLLRSPYSRLREMAWNPENVHFDIGRDYREAAKFDRTITEFHTARTQYGLVAATRNPFSSSLLYREDVLDHYIENMIESPKSVASKGLATKFREFQRHVKYYVYVEVPRMFNEFATVLVRRARVSPRQAIFNAEHHRFTTFRAVSRHLCVYTVQWFHPYKQNARFYKFSKEQRQAFSTTLAQFSECDDKITRIYSYRILPLLQRRLALEPPAAIARQYARLPKYWKSHWQVWSKITAQEEQNEKLFQGEIKARTDRKVYRATIHPDPRVPKDKNKERGTKGSAKSNNPWVKRQLKDGEELKKQPLKRESKQLEKQPA